MIPVMFKQNLGLITAILFVRFFTKSTLGMGI